MMKSDSNHLLEGSDMKASRVPRPCSGTEEQTYDYSITHEGRTYEVKRLRRGHFGCEGLKSGSLGSIKQQIAEGNNVEVDSPEAETTDPIKSRSTWLHLSAEVLLAEVWLRGAIPADLAPLVYETLDCNGFIDKETDKPDVQAVEQAKLLYEKAQMLSL